MTDDERLAVAADLVAAAVLHGNDLALRVAAARALDFEPMVPLRFAYLAAEKVRDQYTLNLSAAITTNGDSHD